LLVQWHQKPEGRPKGNHKKNMTCKVVIELKVQITDLDQGTFTASLARLHTLSKHIGRAKINAGIQ